MPSEHDIQTQVKRVELEYSAVRLAMDRLTAQVAIDPTQLSNNLEVHHLTIAHERLEATYFIRLFAEFESALRNFWRTTRSNDPPVRTRDLVESIGRRRKIPDDRLAQSHSIREYRNSLVHEGQEPVGRITLATARNCICHYLSFLPMANTNSKCNMKVDVGERSLGRLNTESYHRFGVRTEAQRWQVILRFRSEKSYTG